MDSVLRADRSVTELLERSLISPDGRRDVAGSLMSLSGDQVRTALLELIDLVDEFVRHLAEHNDVSERAVLRSMGIEPGRRAR